MGIYVALKTASAVVNGIDDEIPQGLNVQITELL
jgi:hypothetical protein